jgi:hypothetical protein
MGDRALFLNPVIQAVPYGEDWSTGFRIQSSPADLPRHVRRLPKGWTFQAAIEIAVQITLPVT